MSSHLYGMLKIVGENQMQQSRCLKGMGMQPTSQAWAPLLPPAHMQQPLTQWFSDSEIMLRVQACSCVSVDK